MAAPDEIQPLSPDRQRLAIDPGREFADSVRVFAGRDEE